MDDGRESLKRNEHIGQEREREVERGEKDRQKEREGDGGRETNIEGKKEKERGRERKKILSVVGKLAHHLRKEDARFVNILCNKSAVPNRWYALTPKGTRVAAMGYAKKNKT